MQSSVMVSLCAVAVVVALFSQGAGAMPPAQCNGPLETMPPRIRKVCDALSTIYELRGAMEAYLDDKAMYYPDHELMDTGVKRQDVDHVFLRFGRRR